MKAYDISSTCIQFQTRILDVFVANKSIQLKYSIQCCALGLKFLSFPLTPVSLERKIRKLSPVAKERERNTRENISTTKNLFSLRTVSNHIHRGTKVCAILIFLFYFTHSVNVFIHFTHFFSRIFRWLPMTRSLRTDFVANAHRSALTCTLVNTRIIAKPRNRETDEPRAEYHARCIARRNDNGYVLNVNAETKRFPLVCKMPIRPFSGLLIRNAGKFANMYSLLCAYNVRCC